MLPDKKRHLVSKYLVKKCKNGLVAIFLMVQLELNVDLKKSTRIKAAHVNKCKYLTKEIIIDCGLVNKPRLPQTNRLCSAMWLLSLKWTVKTIWLQRGGVTMNSSDFTGRGNNRNKKRKDKKTLTVIIIIHFEGNISAFDMLVSFAVTLFKSKLYEWNGNVFLFTAKLHQSKAAGQLTHCIYLIVTVGQLRLKCSQISTTPHCTDEQYLMTFILKYFQRKTLFKTYV